MGTYRNAKRATLLDLTLVPYQSTNGRDFVRICREEVELADVEECKVAAWLAAHQRHTAATSSRENKARRRSSGMQVVHLVRFLSLGNFSKAGVSTEKNDVLSIGGEG